jgi:ATP-dependent protease ClpP protease subunit
MARSREGPPESDQPAEIAVVGDLSERESDLTEKLLEVPAGGACTLYFDCPGGSAYTALSVTTLMLLRGLEATGIVTGECSSAALWPLAACRRRIVTPHSVLLFHPMKWHSEEHVGIAEAAEWARHFGHLEDDMDRMLARLLGVPLEKIAAWLRPGRYVSGREFHEFGFAELVEFEQLLADRTSASRGRKPPESRSRRK